MSGLFGILHADDRPAAAGDLAAMAGAMAGWGPDGQETLLLEGAGMGHLKLLATPEARAERLPLLDPQGGFLATASARLDDRDELGEALGIAPPGRKDLPDTALLLEAWRAWGEAGLPRLRGDWALAWWDARERRLALARDPYGQTSLYWTCDGRRLAFASAQKALLALPWVGRDLDDLRLAQVLTAWPGDGLATAYRAIRRLPPGHWLDWRGGEVRLRPYWHLEEVPEVRLGSDDAYVDAFLDLFGRAVRTRLRAVRPLGTTLSGGLDSSSVTALAAREGPLTALTSVPLHPPDADRPGRLPDEGPLARALADRWPGVSHVLVRAEGIGPLEGIEHMLRVHAEPGHAAANQYWIAALLAEARARGLGVLLTGQGGNAGISWSGSGERAWRYLLAGEPGRALRDLGAWRKTRRQSWFQALKSQILRPLLAPLRRRPGAWLDYSAIRPAFARELDLEARMRAAGHDPAFPAHRDSRALRLAILQPGRSIVGALWAEAGAAHGLEVRDPTADVRLLEFCLGCPDDQYSRGGQDRWLLRRAMAGLLPDAIRTNRLRGLQAGDLGQRLRAQGAACEAWLDALAASEACTRRLDLDRMRAVLAGEGRAIQVGTILCRGLGVGRFLLG